MTLKTILLQLVWCWASKMPRLTGLKPSALSAFSLFEEQAQALLSYCHFHSFLILHYIYTTFHHIHYIPQRSNAKNCFRITGLQRQDWKPNEDNNTSYSPSKSITECIKFTKRAELGIDFWQLDDIFEPPGRSEFIVWKKDSRFFLSRQTHPTGV